MMLIGAMELAIEQARLYEKSCRLADQLKHWQSIFRNDARIYAENPTEDNKMNMDISAKQVEVNKNGPMTLLLSTTSISRSMA